MGETEEFDTPLARRTLRLRRFGLSSTAPAVPTGAIADLYTVAVAVQQLTQRLPQTFEQLRAPVAAGIHDVASDNDTPAGEHANAAMADLSDAARYAHQLCLAVDAAVQALRHLYQDKADMAGS